MRRLNQLLLRRLRLLLACLLLAVAVEPPSVSAATCTPAQIVAIAEARSNSAPRMLSAAAPSAGHVTAELAEPRIRIPAAGERPRVAPPPDGRHLYLENCALLC